jgi:hypothetical protein
MKRFNGQLTTVSTDKLSAFNTDEYLRAVEWSNRPEDVKMRYPENDNALLAFLRTVPLSKKNIKNPIVRFTVDGALATFTKIVGDVAVDGTSIVVEDSYIADVGWTVVAPLTGEEMLITAVNNSTNTWTVTRARFGGTQVALTSGEELRPMAPATGEKGRAKDTHTTEPGDPSYNYITLTLGKAGITTMQRNAAMNGDWGTWDFSKEGAQYQIETAVQNSLLFQHRWTEASAADAFGTTVSEGQVYRGAGLIPQLDGNVLDLGDSGTNFLYENISEFVDPMFASNLSDSQKICFSGYSLFNDARTTSMQRGESGEVSIDIETGAEEFEFRTSGGKKVMFRKIGGMDGRLANLGLVLDARNLGASEYDGLGPQWFMDTQDNDAVLETEAVYCTSWEAHIYDRTTCGLIRGGTIPLLP